MHRTFDLSHPIRNQPPCTFTSVNKVPKVHFEEGDAHGLTLRTSCLSGLYSNTCTHIDFPGHIDQLKDKFERSVGQYPIDRFVGSALVVDVSHKVTAIKQFFDMNGFLNVPLEDNDRIMEFLDTLGELEISAGEIATSCDQVGVKLTDLKGVLFYSGLGAYWRYEVLESWRFIYFYNPYMSPGLCRHLVTEGLSFVGVDTFQLEHPVINFGGDEQCLAINSQARTAVLQRLRELETMSNHSMLLSNNVLIYENLNILPVLATQVIQFSGVPLNLQLDGLNDNALTRAYADL